MSYEQLSDINYIVFISHSCLQVENLVGVEELRDNFSRNVSYRDKKIRYEYQSKIVPNCQIKYWNQLDLGLKNCIKAMPTGIGGKLGVGLNYFKDRTFYNFKVNNFKKSYSEILIYIVIKKRLIIKYWVVCTESFLTPLPPIQGVYCV